MTERLSYDLSVPDTEMCEVRIKAVPKSLAIFIAVPRDQDTPEASCSIPNWDNTGVSSQDGTANLLLRKGGRYCLRFWHQEDPTLKNAFGGFLLFCGNSDVPFTQIPVMFTSKGYAEGDRCFTVRCEEA